MRKSSDKSLDHFVCPKKHYYGLCADSLDINALCAMSCGRQGFFKMAGTDANFHLGFLIGDDTAAVTTRGSNLLSLLVFSLGVFAVSKLEIKANIPCSQNSKNYAIATMMKCPNIPSLMDFGVLEMFRQHAKPKAQVIAKLFFVE